MKFTGTIYLDNNSTTPVDPEVLKVMVPYFTNEPGNAASRHHSLGRAAEHAIDDARNQIAGHIKATPEEILFTSGATESINTALKGIAARYHRKGRHFVSCVTEHPAVLDTLDFLEKQGCEVTLLPVDENGQLDLENLCEAIREDTICVALMHANNETGVINPVKQIGQICNESKVVFFCDATQALGKIPINVQEMGIDAMAISAHKLYGPKGVGALYLSKRKRVAIQPLLHGGGHEFELRSGTPNVPGIVGFAKAVGLSIDILEKETARMTVLRSHLEEALLKQLDAVMVNNHSVSRLPHVSNIQFTHVDGEALMSRMGPGIAVSSGSACTSSDPDPSHVLLAMGLSDREAKSSIRFSLGRFTEREEIDEAIQMIVKSVNELRAENPVWELYKEGLL